VITHGIMFHTAELWQSVGFKPRWRLVASDG